MGNGKITRVTEEKPLCALYLLCVSASHNDNGSRQKTVRFDILISFAIKFTIPFGKGSIYKKRKKHQAI